MYLDESRPNLKRLHDGRHQKRQKMKRRARPQTRSSAIATPCPTPMHMVESERLPPPIFSSSAAAPVMRAPDMPSGWPRAMAPPFGLTRGSSSATPRSRRTARP